MERVQGGYAIKPKKRAFVSSPDESLNNQMMSGEGNKLTHKKKTHQKPPALLIFLLHYFTIKLILLTYTRTSKKLFWRHFALDRGKNFRYYLLYLKRKIDELRERSFSSPLLLSVRYLNTGMRRGSNSQDPFFPFRTFVPGYEALVGRAFTTRCLTGGRSDEAKALANQDIVN